jgi:hypothetical protein
MASNLVPLAVDEPSEQGLTRDEWWELFDKLRLTQQPAYAEVGGPVAFLRRERDADTLGGWA